MRAVKVKCHFTVEYELEVQVEEGECPIEKLCNKDIFRENTTNAKAGRFGGQFGLDYLTCLKNGIELLSAGCYGDPSPTGRGRFVRDWEIDEGGE